MRLGNFFAGIIAAGWLLGCASNKAVQVDTLAMYGQPQIIRPAAQQKSDAEFIDQAVALSGSRKDALKLWWEKGQTSLQHHNPDAAIRHYNKAWLLDPKDYRPFWGFARVLLQRGKIDDAITYIEKAEALVDDPVQRIALLADVGTIYYTKGKQNPAYLQRANKKFAECIQLDPKQSKPWQGWAFSLFKQGDYKGAWEKVFRAKQLDLESFPAVFIAALEAKSPRPSDAQFAASPPSAIPRPVTVPTREEIKFIPIPPAQR